jgi:hypothetical protein
MNSWYVVAVLALLVGLGLMGTAQVMPEDDCTPGYTFSATTTDEPATTDFADLPPDARETFAQAVAHGESEFLDSRTYRDHLDGEVIRYEGRNYTTQTHSVGDCGGDPRAFVFIGGGLVAASSVLFAALGVFGTLLRRYS